MTFRKVDDFVEEGIEPKLINEDDEKFEMTFGCDNEDLNEVDSASLV